MLVRIQPCAPNEEKLCKCCNKIKSIDEFYGYFKNGKQTYQYYCKACALAKKLKWCENNRDNLKEYKILKKYNLTKAQYEDLYISQNKLCAICSTSIALYTKATHVDHCHKTGKVRGLLCTVCNTGLGIYEKFDNMDNVKSYLSR